MSYDTIATISQVTSLLMFVGIVSYEWFLIHQPMFIWARDIAGSTGGKLGLYLLTVGVPVILTFLFAIAVYHYFSLPIMRWGRNRLDLKKQAVQKSAALPGRAE